jgi:hypothetical protein
VVSDLRPRLIIPVRSSSSKSVGVQGYGFDPDWLVFN